MVLIDDILIGQDVLAKRFVCDIEKCKGACCKEGDYGAPLEDEELEILEEVYPSVKSYLPDEQRARIEEIGVYDYYKKSKEYGTSLMPDGACVYVVQDKSGTLACGIEKAYTDGKITFKKPISCHLYPIRVSKNKKTGFEALNYDEWDICSAACKLGDKLGIPVYRFLKDAIIRKYGAEFYEALDAAYHELT